MVERSGAEDVGGMVAGGMVEEVAGGVEAEDDVVGGVDRGEEDVGEADVTLV